MIYPEYKRVKITLIIICMAIILVGRTKEFWPITSWSLYSQYRPQFPSSSATLFQVIVFSKDNQSYEIQLTNLLAEEHLDKLTIPLIQRIVAQDKQNSSQIYRQSLINLFQKTLHGVDIYKIEIWELEWTVSPLFLPPLNYEHPKQRTLKGTIVVEK